MQNVMCYMKPQRVAVCDGKSKDWANQMTLLSEDAVVKDILIIGDSFVEGVGAQDKNGWAQMLSAQYTSHITISGVGGDTIKTLSRLPRVLEKKHKLVVRPINTDYIFGKIE